MFTFDPLPHAEAVSRIAKLPLVSREVMDGLLPELRAYAFTISGLDVGDQMAKVRDMIKAVPAGEKAWDKARKEIAAELADNLGGKAAQRRAELLLRTHVFRSYAATRYRNLMQQVDVFPFWQYRAHGDGRVRPSHAALNGKIFPAGHEIWQRIFPPWDWGCRCIVVPLTRAAVERLTRKPVVSDEAARAILLPTQLAVAEVYDAHMADMILKAERLPGGIPLNRTPTFSDSPWSIPGNVHHDWKLIQARYTDQPEVLAAFTQWADKQEITPGKTVSMWIDNAQSIAPQPPKLTLKKQFQKQSQRSVADVAAALDAIAPAYDAAHARVQAAAADCAAMAPDAEEYPAAYARLKTAEERLKTVQEQARSAVSVPTKERGRLKITVKGVKPKNLKAGRALVERYTHADLLQDVTLKTDPGRAEAGFDRSFKAEVKESASTLAHEITHITEYSDAPMLARARDFLAGRRHPGEMPVRMDAVYPGHGYQPWEIALEDDWAKRGGEAYAGKLYFPGVDIDAQQAQWLKLLQSDPDQAMSQIVGTETLSMGIERLAQDPIAFRALDPDYFAFVVSTLQKLTP